jgi:hypothetical protein
MTVECEEAAQRFNESIARRRTDAARRIYGIRGSAAEATDPARPRCVYPAFIRRLGTRSYTNVRCTAYSFDRCRSYPYLGIAQLVSNRPPGLEENRQRRPGSSNERGTGNHAAYHEFPEHSHS